VDVLFQIWNDPGMQLSDLRIFLRVLDSGSLSGAARATGLPKSSISRALNRLETDVGAALLDRSGRRVKVTDAGSALQPHAVSLLSAAEEAQVSIDSTAGLLRGTLKVNAPFALAAILLSPMLADFLKRYPDLDLVLEVDNRKVDLAAEEVDVALRIGPLPSSELVARHLTDMALWTCASPAYLVAHGTPHEPSQLSAHRLLSRINQPARWRYTSAKGEHIEVSVPPRTVIPDVAALLPILVGGCGIGRLPDFLAAPAIRDGSLSRLLPDHASDVVELHAVYTNRKTLSTKAQVFIDAVAGHLSELQRTWK
jgi:DNA-binding transcriptional LysR family regulator